MFSPSYVLLYVEDPAVSAAFYAPLLGREPVAAAPTFVLFALDHGMMLGLWSRREVEPAVVAGGGAGELAIEVKDAATVAATYADWCRRGLAIAQPPTRMDFGPTFVALDPDRHRLRVFAPAAAGAAP